MNRIPTEGLKPAEYDEETSQWIGLNEQNPDRGIETATAHQGVESPTHGLNEQNPDRGIETGSAFMIRRRSRELE